MTQTSEAPGVGADSSKYDLPTAAHNLPNGHCNHSVDEHLQQHKHGGHHNRENLSAAAEPPADKESPANKKTETTRCGFGPCAPQCLQVCAVPICYLFCICILVLVQSFIVSGYSSAILTTIEKRYQLWSSELGFIISSYDITAVLAGIFVSYFGDSGNRARWLSRGGVLIAVGAVTLSLPHFLGGNQKFGYGENATFSDVGICNHTSQALPLQTCEEGEDALKDPETWAFAVFVVGFMLIGIGASPIYTLGPTYLYDNMPFDRYPLYSAIMYSMGALGPAAGFLVGAAVLNIYVFPGEAPPGVKPTSDDWIGAWWIGCLMTASMALLVSIPLTFFPRELPNVEEHINCDDKPAFASYGSRLKDFPMYFKKLITNKTWVMIALTFVTEQSVGTGFNRFIAKYMQLAFNLPATDANLYTGCVLIPAAVLGIISGGVLMNKLKPSISGTAKLLLCLNIVPTVLMGTLLALGCDSINLVGVTDFYGRSSAPVERVSVTFKLNLTAECNAACQCKEAVYAPVCGTNARTYYNPCYAGCTKLHVYVDPDGTLVKNYSSCACIYDEFVHSQAANTGRCDNGCTNLIPSLVIMFVAVFFATCGFNPAILILLRSVDPNTRSFALGMNNFFSQVLAFIPAPIYFGQIFDSQCILWTPSCDGTGACLEYDTHTLPYMYIGTCLGLKLLVFVCLILTYLAARSAEHTKNGYDFDMTSGKGNTGETWSQASRETSVSTISVSFATDQSSFTTYDHNPTSSYDTKTPPTFDSLGPKVIT